MTPSKKLKVLWAVDAFDDLPEVHETEVKVLQSFAQRTQIEVDPIYILSPTELGVAVEFSAQWNEVYAPAAKKALSQKLKNAEIPGLQEPIALTQNRASLKGSVELLAKFAGSRSYDLIIVGSHSRKGVQRVVLGSFAEELLLQSEVPVLVVGNHSRKWNDKDMQILMPSDLSDSRSPLFDEVFDLAQTFGAKVTLLNAIPKPIQQVVQSGAYLLSGGWVPVPIYLEDIRSKLMEIADKILVKAKTREVPCDLIVDDLSLSITDSILKQAEQKGVQLIAMEAETGPIASALLGSITRKVVRAAPCPVLVYRFKRRQ